MYLLLEYSLPNMFIAFKLLGSILEVGKKFDVSVVITDNPTIVGHSYPFPPVLHQYRIYLHLGAYQFPVQVVFHDVLDPYKDTVEYEDEQDNHADTDKGVCVLTSFIPYPRVVGIGVLAPVVEPLFLDVISGYAHEHQVQEPREEAQQDCG